MKQQTQTQTPVFEQSEPLIIQGAPISPGYAQGTLYLQPGLLGPVDIPLNSTQHNVEEEFYRLDEATAKISDDLLILAARVEKEIDAHLAAVFGAHREMLNDQVLKEELRKEIVDNLATAGSAVKSVFLRWETRFLLMESAMAREKSDDLRDISIRLRNALAGITVHPLEAIPEDCILVTQRLLPSDTVFLGRRSVAAVLLEYGTTGSHAALFARQMGVPCISDIPEIMNRLPRGAAALVDAHKGVLTVNPNREMLEDFDTQVKSHKQIFHAARVNATKPAITTDGVIIHVNANIGCNEDSLKAVEYGADGIGLYRLEQFYIGRTNPPGREELIAEMRHTLAPFKGKPVCVRLLDAGSDKPLPFIGFMAETNPVLGRRGIRLMRKYPELLKMQLQAILALHKEFEMQCLVPMITLPEDIQFVRNMLTLQCNQLNIRPPELGAMIETPAAALSAKTIAPFVDFMSFGTNDLTQYVFAADRENAAVEEYFNDASDVIFRLMALVHSDVPAMKLSICGELAGRSEHIARMLRCGICSLSVAPPLVAMVKETIRVSEGPPKAGEVPAMGQRDPLDSSLRGR
ncbi:MAG: phosphoenolpyruvate--protein phosphotransferase [Deltaproteobacteria bacterium]|nr:phosphoenolpyruvate--protein phosphotransferase [Deltaproteobacteria bacterium]